MGRIATLPLTEGETRAKRARGSLTHEVLWHSSNTAEVMGGNTHRMSAPACRGAHSPYGDGMASGDALAKEMSQGQPAQLTAPQHSTTEKQAQCPALFASPFALVLFSFIVIA